MSSRQSIARSQSIAKKDARRSRNQASNLIDLSQRPAPSVLKETVYDETIAQPVLRQKATESFWVGNLFIESGEYYYLIESKFLARYWVVAERGYRASASTPSVDRKSVV